MKKIIIGIGIIVLFFALSINYFFPSDLTDLKKERKIAVQEIRPHLIKFKKDKDCFPKFLAELVPNYIKEIPLVLQQGDYEGAYKISYGTTGDDAYFSFHASKGPDSRITYHVDSGKFVYDQ